jgi:hypothetical protein
MYLAYRLLADRYQGYDGLGALTDILGAQLHGPLDIVALDSGLDELGRNAGVRGVEAYWHRRFQDKRMRGEWFRLNPADIKTFRRRRRIYQQELLWLSASLLSGDPSLSLRSAIWRKSQFVTAKFNV